MAFFMDNLQAFNRPVRGDDGELVVNLAVRSDIPVSLVSTADIGAFAAIAFDQPATFIGRTVELAGDYLTPPQTAESIGRHAGLTARSHQVPVAQVKPFDEHVGQQLMTFVPALTSSRTLAETWKVLVSSTPRVPAREPATSLQETTPRP